MAACPKCGTTGIKSKKGVKNCRHCGQFGLPIYQEHSLYANQKGQNMSQSKIMSMIETGTNVAVGFVISGALTYGVLPLWGFMPNVTDALYITAIYTVASILRSFGLRRFFNFINETQ